MSWQATAWAEKQKTGSPARKVLLLVLANYANDDGVCWPSITTLSISSEMSTDAVRRNLKELVEAGLISVSSRHVANGRQTSNAYQLPLEGVGSHNATLPEMQGGRVAKCEGDPPHSTPPLNSNRKVEVVVPEGTTTGRDYYNTVTDSPGTQENQKTVLFRKAEQMMGKIAGSLIGQLLKANGGDVGAGQRLLDRAAEAVDAELYIRKAISNLKASADYEAAEARQIAEWKPTSAKFPPRDYSHPRQLYYLTSKVRPGRKLYLNTERVHDLIYDKADELGVVL